MRWPKVKPYWQTLSGNPEKSNQMSFGLLYASLCAQLFADVHVDTEMYTRKCIGLVCRPIWFGRMWKDPEMRESLHSRPPSQTSGDRIRPAETVEDYQGTP